MTKFRDLSIGDEFDFIGPDRYNSFYERCVKISARKYRYPNRRNTGEIRPKPFDYYISQVGSINAEVFHVIKHSEENGTNKRTSKVS